jgi:hypothetical protein
VARNPGDGGHNPSSGEEYALFAAVEARKNPSERGLNILRFHRRL